MRALVSGQAGLAVLIEKDHVYSVHIAAPGPVPRSAADIPYLLADANDVVEISEATPQKVAVALDLSWRQDRALHLILILLDREADDDTRRVAVECLEEFACDPAVADFVCNRLYSGPLPDSADMVGALLLAESMDAKRLNKLLEDLGEFQPEIRRRREEWDALRPELFGGPQAKLEFGYIAVASGTLRRLVQSDPEQVNSVLVDALADPQFQRLMRSREVLTSWIKSVRTKRGSIRTSEKDDEDERDYSRHRRATPEAEKPKRSHAVFENVNKQKEAIKRAIFERRHDRVEKYVRDLIDYQLRRSEREDIARSLCDLATYAKGLGAHAVQLELATRATTILPTDGWSQAQLADAYLCVGRFDDAFAAYGAADICGEVEIARKGRAEVLKGMGRLEEALREYEAAIREFPHDVVARAGRAEVLKGMGRLEEALQEYEATVREFPESVVARNGRAEVLKGMGRLEEALREYEATVRDFPESAVARNGRAGVLKGMGRLEEALQEYEATVREFPNNVIARTGRAEVLRGMGRLEEALREYEATVREFPNNVFARSGRAEVLKGMGRLEEALREYEVAVREFPENVVACNGRAEVLKGMGRLEEALREYEATVREFPNNVFARTGRAEVLKGMGRLEEALQEYEATVRELPHDVFARTGRAEVLKGMGRLEEALHEYEATVREFPNNVIARTGRAEVLKGMGRLEEALQEYEAIAREFPHDVVARSGRAEVLKGMGRLEEALREYEATVHEFPNDVVARSGRAEVLKGMGRLEEALQEYEATVREFPHDVFARTGRAEVLKGMGRLEEALQEYDAAVRDFPENVVSRNGRAEVLKGMGRLEQALQEYEGIRAKFPSDNYSQVGMAAVLVLLGRYDEALRLVAVQTPRTLGDWIGHHIRGMVSLKKGDLVAAIQIFERGLRESPWHVTWGYFRRALAVARLWRSEFLAAVGALGDEHAPVSEVLRGHAFGGLGQTEEAKTALDAAKGYELPVLVEVRKELLLRYIARERNTSIRSDDWLFERECELVLAAYQLRWRQMPETQSFELECELALAA
jgi:tetratricopeptide (TPR) repeat protein